MTDMVRVPRQEGSHRFGAPSMRLGRSQFRKKHKHVTSFDASKLIPIFVREVLPGETHNLSMDSLIRIFSPLDAPIFDNIHCDVHFFFVPNRLVWSNWQAFCGEHDAAGAQDTDFTVPILSGAVPVEEGSLANYMGHPIGLDYTVTDVQSLPFRGYGLVYNQWFRDQSLIDRVAFGEETGNGPDAYEFGDVSNGRLRTSAKRPDYFTTALPYLQKGDAQAAAMAGTADVRTGTAQGGSTAVYGDLYSEYRDLDASGADVSLDTTAAVSGEKLYVDLSGGTVDLNALREAAAVQRLLERDARGGTRYNELLRSHFGVDIGDARIQRSEYIGGGSGFIQVSPVANTSGTATEDQGQLAGIGAGRLSCRWAQSFTEHGHILGILRARAELGYHQGLDRMWSRSTRFDFYWPELANLGEQPIYNRELWIEGDATDDAVFGYVERYSEYRWARSLITGLFAPDATGSLDYWHLAEDFASQPVLNSTFIEDASPMARVTTVDTAHDFIVYADFDWRVASPMPVRPVPSLAPARF